MTHTRESRKIAAAIVGLGNSLSLTTVAEGVEDQTIADMLLWLGCDIGQGWLYGRPVPPEQLPETLAERMNPPPASSPAEPRSAAADSNLPSASKLCPLSASPSSMPSTMASLSASATSIATCATSV